MTNKQWKLGRRILAGALAALLIGTTVGTDLPSIVGERIASASVSGDDVGGIEPYGLDPGYVEPNLADDDYNFEGVKFTAGDIKKVTYNNNGDITNVETLTSSSTVKDNDTIRIDLSWKIGDATGNDNVKEYSYTFDPIQGVSLKPMESPKPLSNSSYGNVGTYQVLADGSIKIVISNDMYLHDDKKNGNISIDAVISGAPDEGSNGTEKTIKLGDKSMILRYDDGTTASTTSTQKSAVGSLQYDSGSGKFYQEFKVDIRANNGSVSDIQITDTPGAMFDAPSSFTVTGNGGMEGLPTGTTTLADLNSALSGKTLADGQTLSITYRCEVSDATSQDSNNKVDIAYKNNKNEPKTSTSTAYVNVNRPTATKTGVMADDNSKITWTVTIALNDFKNMPDDQILFTDVKDTPGKGLAGANTSITLEKNQFTYNAATGTYTYTYTTDVDAAYQNSNTNFTNKFEGKINGVPIDITGTAKSKNPPPPGEVTKSFNSFDFATRELTWDVEIRIPADAKQALIQDVVKSWVPGTLGDHSVVKISVEGKTVIDKSISNSPLDTSIAQTGSSYSWPWPNGFYLTSSYLDSIPLDPYNSKYKLLHVQTVTQIPANEDMTGKVYSNRFDLTYTPQVGDSTRVSSNVPTYRFNGASVSKTGKIMNHANYPKETVIYNVKTVLDSSLNLKVGDNIIMRDVLPEGMELITNNPVTGATSTVFKIANDWGTIVSDPKGTVEVKTEQIDGKERNVVYFTVPINENNYNRIQAAYNGGNNAYITVEYKAKPSNVLDLIENGTKEYTNNVEGYVNDRLTGEYLGNDSSTVKITPPKTVGKTYKYNIDTAPFAEYTVHVNENAYSLVDGGTLSATDSITNNSVLSYVYTSIVVEKETASGFVKCIAGEDYSLSYDDSHLYFTNLKDATHYRITYKMRVQGKENSPLATSQTTNNFALDGVNGDSGNTSTKISGTVLKSSGEAFSDDTSVSFLKGWTNGSGNTINLPGAKFDVYEYMWDTTSSSWVRNTVNQTATLYYIDEEGHEVTDGSGTQANGKVFINKLSTARVYELVETQAPTGFKANTDRYYFRVGAFTGGDAQKSTAGLYKDAGNTTSYTSWDNDVKNFNMGSEVLFTNEQSIDATDSITFAGKKILQKADGTVLDGTSGNELQIDASNPYAFEYAVEQLSTSTTAAQLAKNPTGTKVASGTSGANGTVTFGTIHYDASKDKYNEGTDTTSGTYIYKIYETGAPTGATYASEINMDKSYYIVKVALSLNNTNPSTPKLEHKITSIVKYSYDDTTKSYVPSNQTVPAVDADNQTNGSATFSFDFANEEIAKTGTFKFTAKKTVDGNVNAQTAGMFVFSVAEITDLTEIAKVKGSSSFIGKPVATVITAMNGGNPASNKNAANGDIVFADSLVRNYTLSDVSDHYYMIYENNLTGNANVNYTQDKGFYVVHVNVANVAGQADLKVTSDVKYYANTSGSNYAAGVTKDAVVFDNATKEKTAEIDFAATKYVNGVIPTEAYNFAVYEKDYVTSAETEIMSGSNATSSTSVSFTKTADPSKGTINVNKITYKYNATTDDTGVYEYVIRETSGSTAEITVDNAYYVVKVTVTNDPAQTDLTVTKTITRYVKGSGSTTAIADNTGVVFNNVKTPTASASFETKKSVDGSSTGLNAGEFDFVLEELPATTTDADFAGDLTAAPTGTVLSEGQNDATGKVTFTTGDKYSSRNTTDVGASTDDDETHILTAGSQGQDHYYKIYEKTLSGQDNTYAMDQSFYIVKVNAKVEGNTEPTLAKLVVTNDWVYEYTPKADGTGFTRTDLNVPQTSVESTATDNDKNLAIAVNGIAFKNTTKDKLGSVAQTAVKLIDTQSLSVGYNMYGNGFSFGLFRINPAAVPTDATTLALYLDNGYTALLSDKDTTFAEIVKTNNNAGDVNFGDFDSFTTKAPHDGYKTQVNLPVDTSNTSNKASTDFYYVVYEKELDGTRASEFTKDMNYYVIKVTVTNSANQTGLEVTKTINKYTYNPSSQKYTSSVVANPNTAALQFNNITIEQTGTLKLTKTVAGLGTIVDRNKLDNIAFTITPGVDGFASTTYYLNEKDASNNYIFQQTGNGVFTLTIDNVPVGKPGTASKTYQVQEVAYGVDGYVISSVTYKVDTGATQTASTVAQLASTKASAAVKPNTTTNVYVGNTYAPDQGELTITKTIAGRATWNQVKNSLSFEVVNKATGEVYATVTPGTNTALGTPVTFVQAAGDTSTYTYTFHNVPSGTYTVRESAYDAPGFGCVVAVRDITNGSSSSWTEDVTSTDTLVTSVRDANIAFRDTYEAEPIQITFNKTVSGLTTSMINNYVLPDLEFQVYKGESPDLSTAPLYTVTLTAADYANGVYSKTIKSTQSAYANLEPGKYTIVEKATGQLGSASQTATLVSTNYQIVHDGVLLTSGTKNTGIATGENKITATGTGATALDVSYGSTIRADFTNTYLDQSDVPSIQIVKVVDGDANWDEVRDSLTFTIRPSAGATTMYAKLENGDVVSLGSSYTVKGSDGADPAYNRYFVFKKGDDGNYYCTIPLSKYDTSNTPVTVPTSFVVTETCDMDYAVDASTKLGDIYKLSRSYEVSGVNVTAVSTTETTTGQATVAGFGENSAAIVKFTNEYTKPVGRLRLNKVMNGIDADDITKVNLYKDITFTITPGIDGVSASTEVKMSELTMASDNKTFSKTFENVPVGTYSVTESNAALTGYTGPSTTYQVVSASGTESALGQSSVAVVDSGTSQFRITNTYAPVSGDLAITKTFAGIDTLDLTDAEKETFLNNMVNSITFDIKNNQTNVVTNVALNDATKFVYDATTKTYTYTISNVRTGNYTITEKNYSVPEYTTKVSYVVGTDTGTADNVVVTVNQDETTTAAITNTYSEHFGILVLTKSLAGGATYEDVRDDVTFTITNVATGETETHYYNEFAKDPVTNLYTLELPLFVGTYNVTETVQDTEGLIYKSTSYTLDAGTQTDGLVTTDFAMVQDGTVKVDYLNTYEVVPEDPDDPTPPDAPTPPEDPKKPDNPGSSVTPPASTPTTPVQTFVAKLVKTGDGTNLFGLVLGFVVALVGMTGCFVFYKKRRR